MYDGVLDFEPDTTITGLAVKTYVVDPVYIDRFAAGFGKALRFFPKGGYLALRYVQVGGEAFGTEQFPVATEPDEPATDEVVSLAAWPNPFRARLSLGFALPKAGAVTVEVVDVLGRVVRRRDLGVLPAGRHEVQLRTPDLAAGPYLVRLVAGETLWETRTVTRLR